MSYSLSLEIDVSKIIEYNENGFQLCFASGVTSSSRTSYNVVAHTDMIGQQFVIEWTDEYGIAASKTKFNDGVKFTASTRPSTIGFGQSYTLPQDWSNGSVSSDSQAPSTGFSFINNTNGAAAVVYRNINGNLRPIFISPDGPLPSGKEDLSPAQKVAVWFAQGQHPGTMVSRFGTGFQEIDFTGKTRVSASYGADGRWTIN